MKYNIADFVRNAKRNGIRSALMEDFVHTMLRHPTLAEVLIAGAVYMTHPRDMQASEGERGIVVENRGYGSNIRAGTSDGFKTMSEELLKIERRTPSPFAYGDNLYKN